MDPLVTHRIHVWYIYPQAPSFAQGPKILATGNQKKQLHSTFRVLNLGIG